MPGALLLWIRQYLFGGADLGNLAAIEERDPRRHFAGEGHLVRREHHGQAGLLEVSDHVQHFSDELRIEGGAVVDAAGRVIATLAALAEDGPLEVVARYEPRARRRTNQNQRLAAADAEGVFERGRKLPD